MLLTIDIGRDGRDGRGCALRGNAVSFYFLLLLSFHLVLRVCATQKLGFSS